MGAPGTFRDGAALTDDRQAQGILSRKAVSLFDYPRPGPLLSEGELECMNNMLPTVTQLKQMPILACDGP